MFAMDEHDQANLEFLMNATAQTLADWYAQASEDDLVYASELLDQYAQILDQQTLDTLDFVHASPAQLQ